MSVDPQSVAASQLLFPIGVCPHNGVPHTSCTLLYLFKGDCVLSVAVCAMEDVYVCTPEHEFAEVSAMQFRDNLTARLDLLAELQMKLPEGLNAAEEQLRDSDLPALAHESQMLQKQIQVICYCT